MRPILALVLVLAACGDDGGAATPDGAVDAPDAPPADAPPSNGCDYTEQRDGTNDNVSPATGTAEDTHLVAGTAVICGAFQHTHFDGDITVDIDAYRITINSDAIIRISGAGAEAIELVGVDIYGGPSFDQRVGAVTFYGDHGVTAVSLTAGTYELLPFALHSQAIAATVPYKLSISPGTLCTPLTTGGYPESHDGAANAGNDVIAFPVGSPSALTTSPADMPEPTALTVVPGTQARLGGMAADIATADRYEDKDTFAFATGAGVNELTVQLGWTGAADLDAYLFEATSADPVVRGIGTTAGSERWMFSVKPNAMYWLLVGAKAGGTGLPAAYGATLCGATYAP